MYNKEYYKNKNITIYNGDCVDIMQDLLMNTDTKVDKVITSPPYNIVRPNCTDRGYDLYKDRTMSNEEYISWIINIFYLYNSILNTNGCVIWNMSYGTENTEVMNLCIAEILKQTNFTLVDILVWKKKSATPNNVSSNKMTRIVEFVYVFCRRNEFHTFTANKRLLKRRERTNQAIYENVFNFFEANNNDITQDLNKATFSREFVQEIIDRYVLKTDVVLDTFGGIQTNAYTCDMNNIKCISIELSEKQCEFGVNRIKQGMQTSIFDFLDE